MCGRYTLGRGAREIAAAFDVPAPAFDWAPRYNIAPSQEVPVVRVDGGARRFLLHRWGLVPSWADPRSKTIGYRTINARAESVATRPAYRTAFRLRRCLVIADGFYEWTKGGRAKRPWHFRLAGGEPFAFAGLWERWVSADGGVVDSCSIVTTEANEVVRKVHDRMPVILEAKDHALWLDPDVRDPAKVLPLLRPLAGRQLIAVPVSSSVNDPRNDGPACLEPA